MSLRLRPKFQLHVDATADDVMDQLQGWFDRDPSVLGHRYTHQYEVFIPEDRRHFWSPYLNMLICDRDDGAEIRGQFGPNVNVWTMFMAAYTILGISAFVGLVLGYSQVTLGQPGSGFFICGGCALLALVVYLIGKVGERLAHDQIVELQRFVERGIGHAIEIH